MQGTQQGTSLQLAKKYLEEFEKAEGSLGRLKTTRVNGKLVVEARSGWSLGRWLKNNLISRSDFQELGDRVVDAYDVADRLLRVRIGRALSSKTVPTSVKTDSILERHRDELKLTAHTEQLSAQYPKIRTFAVLQFLRSYSYAALIEPELIGLEHEQLLESLEEHFDQTRQDNIFNELKETASLEAFKEVYPSLPAGKREALIHSSGKDGELVTRLMDRLYRKALNDEPFTGDPSEVITREECLLAKDLTNLENNTALIKSIRTKLVAGCQSIHSSAEYLSIRDRLNNLDADQLAKEIAIIEDLQKQEARLGHEDVVQKERVRSEADQRLKNIEKDLETAARGRALYHRTVSTLGKRFNADVLRSADFVGEQLSTLYKRLEAVNRLRSPTLDLADKQLLQEKHNNKQYHPKVVVAGGGPVGLMQAIRSYQAGAEVTLVEKRSTEYSRSQIVRLDNQWMKDLDYYLGSRFDTLFTSIGPGRLNSDGSGYISIKYLEEALHNQLSELISMDGPPEKLRRLAAHEVTGVEVQTGESSSGYVVKAVYRESADPSTAKGNGQQKTVRLPADILVCADGKNSRVRDAFFRTLPQTKASWYGVCAWSGPDIDAASRGERHFSDFRETLYLDDAFLFAVQVRLRESLDPITGNVGSILDDNTRKFLMYLIDSSPEDLHSRVLSNPTSTEEDRQFASRIMDNPGTDDSSRHLLAEELPMLRKLERARGNYYQLRTFENDGTVYLGMELPVEMVNWLDSLQFQLSSPESNVSEETKAEVLRQVRVAFFQAVADWYGFSDEISASPDTAEQKFAAFFPVELEAVRHPVTVMDDSTVGEPMTVLAVGDAAFSPHFMTASGLTGGRLTMEQAVSLIEAHSEGDLDEIRHAHNSLEASYAEVQLLVLNRSASLVAQLNVNDQYQLERQRLENSRRALVKRIKSAKGDTLIEEMENGQLLVQKGGRSYSIRLSLDDNTWESDSRRGPIVVKDLGTLEVTHVQTFQEFELRFMQS